MPIENRLLPGGTKLVARYKGQERTCDVVSTEDGVKFVLDDGSEHKSPSAAGSAVMKGSACNGWRFWSVEGTEPAPRAKKEKAEGTTATKRSSSKRTGKTKNIKKLPKKDQPDDGTVRYFCSACMKAFSVDVEDGEPAACPEGHDVNLSDELAPDGIDTAETEEAPVEAETEPEDLFATAEA